MPWIFWLCFHFFACSILYLCYKFPKECIRRVLPFYIISKSVILSSAKRHFLQTSVQQVSGCASHSCLHPALLQIRLWPDSTHPCVKREREDAKFLVLLIAVGLLVLSAFQLMEAMRTKKIKLSVIHPRVTLSSPEQEVWAAVITQAVARSNQNAGRPHTYGKGLSHCFQ